jgi:hypothetical protein
MRIAPFSFGFIFQKGISDLFKQTKTYLALKNNIPILVKGKE